MHAGLLSAEVHAAEVPGEKRGQEISAPQYDCGACCPSRALPGEGGAEGKEDVALLLPRPVLIPLCPGTFGSM